MLKAHNPQSIAPPLSPTYVNGMEVPSGGRTLYISGQLGINASGTIVADYEGQCRQVWSNIAKVLESAEMSVADIVKMTAFLVPGKDVALYGKIRGEHLQGHQPASTMLVVAALAKPDFFVEVEVVAWRK